MLWSGFSGQRFSLAVLQSCFFAGTALLLNNKRNQVFDSVVAIVLLAAVLALQWTLMNTRSPRGKIGFALFAALFTWVMIGSWFKKEKTLPDPDGSNPSPVLLEGKSTN